MALGGQNPQTIAQATGQPPPAQPLGPPANPLPMHVDDQVRVRRGLISRLILGKWKTVRFGDLQLDTVFRPIGKGVEDNFDYDYANPITGNTGMSLQPLAQQQTAGANAGRGGVNVTSQNFKNVMFGFAGLAFGLAVLAVALGAFVWFNNNQNSAGPIVPGAPGESPEPSAMAAGQQGNIYTKDQLFQDENGNWLLVTRVNSSGGILAIVDVPDECVQVIKDVGAVLIEDCGNPDPTERPARTPLPPTNGGSTDVPCLLEKNGTWSEIQGAGLQRIEVGGGGVQHMDFYIPGTLAVSYVVPIQEPEIWWGNGSQWERPNGPQCENYDMLIDAQAYAVGNAIAEVDGPVDQPGRLNNGHSGVVVDLTDGGTVYNMGNLSQRQVDDLLAYQRQYMGEDASHDGYVKPDYGNPDPGNDPDNGGSDNGEASCEADADRIADIQPIPGRLNEVPGDGWRVVNFWSNTKGAKVGERKLILSPDQNPRLRGGGSVWEWPAQCERQARAGFNENPLRSVTLRELREEGLAK